MFRCVKCGSGIVEWVESDGSTVRRCDVCSLLWITRRNELDDWQNVRDNAFTNMDELEVGNDSQELG